MKTKIKDIGKVCVTPKGEFDAENGHEKLDIVSYQDRTFIAKKDAPKEILPTNEEYYMKLPVGEKVAEDAAAFATEQGNYAKTQANFATEQGNYAKREADRLSSIDLSLYRVVIDLPNIPSMSDDDKNKIYLKVSAKQGENNKYDEFVVVDNAWELLGQYEAAIDLTDYIGKDELSYEIASLPSLDNISKFICVDSDGEIAGTMSKEQVASVVGGLFAKVYNKYEPDECFRVVMPSNSTMFFKNAAGDAKAHEIIISTGYINIKSKLNYQVKELIQGGNPLQSIYANDNELIIRPGEYGGRFTFQLIMPSFNTNLVTIDKITQPSSWDGYKKLL